MTLLLVVSAFRAASASELAICVLKSVQSALYSTDDFLSEAPPLAPVPVKLPQNRWSEGHEIYRRWAARTSNQAARMFRERRSADAVLDVIARSRARLAKRLGNPDAPYFGVKRLTPAGSMIGDLDPDRVNRALKKGRELPAIAVKRIDRLGVASSIDKVIVPRNLYPTLDGRYIEASEIFTLGRFRNLNVNHTNPDQMLEIMADVRERVRLVLRDRSLSQDQRIDHFLIATFGFYNAMPFLRGSSAIGRSFFNGLHNAAFGRKLAISDSEIDVMAMIMEAPEFLDRYRSALR